MHMMMMMMIWVPLPSKVPFSYNLWLGKFEN